MAHLLAGPIEEVVGNRETFVRSRPLPRPAARITTRPAGRPRGDVTNEDYVGALVRFRGGPGHPRGVPGHHRLAVRPRLRGPWDEGRARLVVRADERAALLRRDAASPTETGWTIELSGPAHPFHRSFNPGWAVGLGFDDLKVIEAAQFLSRLEGVQGPPSFEDAAAVARVQQAIAASWVRAAGSRSPAARPASTGVARAPLAGDGGAQVDGGDVGVASTVV